jgi:hypothetical protein
MRARHLVLSLRLLGLALDARPRPEPLHRPDQARLDGLSVIQQVCQLVGCTPGARWNANPNGAPLKPGSLFLVDSATPLLSRPS